MSASFGNNHHDSRRNTGSTYNTTMMPSPPPSPFILWSSIARNETVVVEAAGEGMDYGVVRTAGELLSRSVTPGWEFHTEPRKRTRKFCRQQRLRGIKFHVIDDSEHDIPPPSTAFQHHRFDSCNTNTEIRNEDDHDDDCHHLVDSSFRQDYESERHQLFANNLGLCTSASSSLQNNINSWHDDDDQDIDTNESKSGSTLEQGGKTKQSQKTRERNHHHRYQEEKEDGVIVWVFSCIYDPSGISRAEVQEFLTKLVFSTDQLRRIRPDWREGSALACQEHFGSVLWGKMLATTTTATTMMGSKFDPVWTNLAHAYICRNIELLLARGYMSAEEADETMGIIKTAAYWMKGNAGIRRAAMWQQARHGAKVGLVVASSISVAIVIPLLVVVL